MTSGPQQVPRVAPPPPVRPPVPSPVSTGPPVPPTAPIPPAPAGTPAPPSRAQLEAAYGAVVPDLVYPGVRLLLCGINPSLWTGYAGYHFARPANRLWLSLYQSGFTPNRLHPAQTESLRAAGLGITNLVPRATARADEVSKAEIRAGRARLTDTVARWRPTHVAVLGVGAFRLAFALPRAQVGPQPGAIAGAALWLLPNPSGLNAHYSQAALSDAFRRLRESVIAATDPG